MIEKLLQKHGVSPNTEMDQHFLDSEEVLEKEIEEADMGEEDVVLEIGAGLGNLTEKLSEKAGKVIAVEKDSRLAEILREKFKDSNVEIVEGDFLKIQEELPDFDKCVSNPPYNLSSDIVETLGEKGKLSVLLLQKDFAKKLVAKPGSSSYVFFTVLTNFYFIPVYIRDVPSRSFVPEPEVDSALVKLFPRKTRFGVEDDEFFLKVVKSLFTHRRKKVRNAVVDSRHILGASKEKLKEIRDSVPHSEERPVNLDIKKIADICKYLENEI